MQTNKTQRAHIAERVLLFFSRDPADEDYKTPTDFRTVDNALAVLCGEFPDFLGLITGKEVLDFGCGKGLQAVAMAQSGAKYVCGVDINREDLRQAQALAQELHLESRTEFVHPEDTPLEDRFDSVISLNSMEHFSDPARAMLEMKSALKPHGNILLTFALPWLSPYGSHMHFFTKIPWVNLLFSERTVMSVRTNFRHDGATRYEEVEGGLNKMTVRKFERIVSCAGLVCKYAAYTGVKRVNAATRIPLIRELLTNRVSCILARP